MHIYMAKKCIYGTVVYTVVYTPLYTHTHTHKHAQTITQTHTQTRIHTCINTYMAQQALAKLDDQSAACMPSNSADVRPSLWVALCY
jgi:hypothetical protein